MKWELISFHSTPIIRFFLSAFYQKKGENGRVLALKLPIQSERLEGILFVVNYSIVLFVLSALRWCYITILYETSCSLQVAPSRSVSVSNLKEYRRQRSIRGKAFRAPFWMMGVCNDEEEDCIVEYGGREKNALAEGGSSGTDGEEEESVMPLRSRMLKAVSRMKMSPRQQITPRDRVEMSPIRADFSNESVSTEKTGDKINKDQPTDDVTTKTEKRKEKINKDRPSDDVTDDVTMKHESATRPEEKKKTRPSKKKKKKKSNTIRVKKTKVMDVTEPTPPSNNFYEQRSTAYKILLSPRGESSSTSGKT